MTPDEHAYPAPCPHTACRTGDVREKCISHATGRRIGVPHRERVQTARERTTTTIRRTR